MNYKKGYYDKDEIKRDFGERYYNWHYKRIIEVKREFTKKELEIIKKLEVEIENELYTLYDYKELKKHLGIYDIKDDINNEQKYIKPFKYGVTKEEYDIIFNKFNEIDKKYKKELNTRYSEISYNDVCNMEKLHFREKFLKFLKEETLYDIQKQQIYNIIMDIKFVSIKQKECFVKYYGLKDKKHKLKEIAKLYNCSTESIRQSIGKVIRRIGDLSDEKVDILRNIIHKSQNN